MLGGCGFEVVDYVDGVSFSNEGVDKVAADESGTAGHQNGAVCLLGILVGHVQFSVEDIE